MLLLLVSLVDREAREYYGEASAWNSRGFASANVFYLILNSTLSFLGTATLRKRTYWGSPFL
jgi:hypothetical protein